MKKSILLSGAIGAGAVSLALVAPAQADVIPIESIPGYSVEGLGHYTGSLAYEFEPQNGVGLFTVSLTNSGTDFFGSYITGIVFNIGGSVDPNRSSTLIATEHEMFVNINNASAVPFGANYDGGAALGGDWLGGGNPNDGIAPGQTGTFAFEITASDAADLSAASFLEGQYLFNFVVRFRGGDFSDKTPAMIVPAPAALALFGIAGLAIRRRRRRDDA